VEQGVHLHDGFYLRMAVGFASLNATFTPDQGLSKSTVTGNGVAMEFGLGGAVADGFILGGKVSSMVASKPDHKIGDQSYQIDGSLALISLQFFADVYPMPEEGFHLQGGIGPASLQFTPSSSSSGQQDSQSTSGFAGSIGLGWEGWVGKQWGIGALFNLNLAQFKDNTKVTLYDNSNSNVQSSITVVVPTLMFTATFN
jgi:hypothetical protein